MFIPMEGTLGVKTSAILVAAGRGTRMGPGIDKLFLPVLGMPVVAHAWKALDASVRVDEVVVVVRSGLEPDFCEMARRLDLRKPWRCVPGGAERQDSVWNGLEGVGPGVEWVAIHDGARPCITPAMVDRCLEAARTTGASVVAQKAIDTIKESDDGVHVTGHPDRARLWAVQTPQCFRRSVLQRALGEVRRQGRTVTDDTAACAWVNVDVRLVECPEPNPKVTVSADIPWVEFLLSRKAGDMA
jgi:2-C-methyl-D-erythritol 4-phosphate cytidylyltransferase